MGKLEGKVALHRGIDFIDGLWIFCIGCARVIAITNTSHAASGGKVSSGRLPDELSSFKKAFTLCERRESTSTYIGFSSPVSGVLIMIFPS